MEFTILILIICFIIIFVCLYISGEESVLIGGLLSLPLLMIMSMSVGEKIQQKEAIKAGVAEWVQVVGEDGGVTNEFRYITPETDAEK